MDPCLRPGLLPIDTALARILQALRPIQEVETLPLHLALDRVLAIPVTALVPVPAADNSAMDGYAVRADDQGERRVLGQSFAGHPFEGVMGPGEAVRIMTGALIPAGADSVIMQENTQYEGDRLQLLSSSRKGDNIRHRGEDIALGTELVSAGTRIDALHIGLLASVGCAQVSVFRKLRVALLTTGDELRLPGEGLEPGAIYDSNRPLLAALLQRLPVEVMDLGIVPDEPAALGAAFRRASEWADVTLSTGGVSVGEADYTKAVLAELGEIDFWKIAMKPGKPVAFGHLGAGWFFGLPGNPVSTAVTYHQLVVPALRLLSGETITAPVVITAQASAPLKKQPGRTDFQRGILTCDQGVQCVSGAGAQSSGVLSTLANANCFIRLEQERGSVAAGESVSVIPFDRYIR